jgi:hypothetical protein
MMRCVALLALSGVATAIPTLRQLQAGGPDKCDEDASFQGTYALLLRPRGTAPRHAAAGGARRDIASRARAAAAQPPPPPLLLPPPLPLLLPPLLPPLQPDVLPLPLLCVCTMWKACHVADRAPLRGGQPGRRSSTRRAAPTRPARAMAACRPRATPSVPTCSRHTSGTARPSCRRPT